jgi:hypothetical protein
LFGDWNPTTREPNNLLFALFWVKARNCKGMRLGEWERENGTTKGGNVNIFK